MGVQIQFINFPNSKMMKEVLTERITHCLQRYFPNLNASVRAHYSVDGIRPHIKVSIDSGRYHTYVSAVAIDAAHTMELVIQKLNSLLRKFTTKRKHQKNEYHSVNKFSNYNAMNMRSNKRQRNIPIENAFDKFETHFLSDFEDRVRKAS